VIRAGGGDQSHQPCAPRGNQTAGTPPTSRRARPRVGAAKRKVARRAAWPRSRPPTPLARRRPRGAAASAGGCGARAQPNQQRGASRRHEAGSWAGAPSCRWRAQLCAPPVFNASHFGVRVPRWLAVGHRTERGETSAIGDGGSWIRRRICALCLADPRVLSASALATTSPRAIAPAQVGVYTAAADMNEVMLGRPWGWPVKAPSRPMASGCAG
jgi:hypothetical protein